MDDVFFDSLFEGDSANGIKLGMGVTGGDFWPRPAGCHTVYRGQDGNMDYDTIQAVMELDDSQVSIANQALPANTIWHYIRRQVSGCGLESDDSAACVVMIDSNGDMMADMPNPPSDLTAERLAGGKVRLRWRYTALEEEVSPTGFKVYIDSGSGFDFNTPDATIAYTLGMGDEFNWTSDALTHGQVYRFCVRSYRTGAGETQNTNFVAAEADSQGPAAITGLRASWQEV